MSKKYAIGLVIALIIVLLGLVIWLSITCRQDGCKENETLQVCGQDEAKEIARQWTVASSPTYKFDGYDLKFKSVGLLKCPYCYQFDFSFKSTHAGYGDRTGQNLLQVITAHVISVTVNQGKVTEAVTDDAFDEIKVQSLENPTTPVPADQGQAAIANPASTYCKQQGGDLELRDFGKGGQKGFCIFEDGSECEEWAFMRKECKIGQKLCKDYCGDGICQEIVCMAVGCPCAEGPQNCLIDCLE